MLNDSDPKRVKGVSQAMIDGIRVIAELYDWETAKAWLFGTNTRLDDQSPVEVLGTATSDQEFTDVARAAKQFASFDR